MTPKSLIPENLSQSWAATTAAMILHLVTQRVRVVGDYQLPGITSQRVRSVMRRLEDRGLLSLRMVMALPELPLKGPVFCWWPGAPAPHAERIAWQLSSRWTGQPRRVLIATATEKACQELGGSLGGRLLRRTEVTHDLHVTALYLKLCREQPNQAELWRHEDASGSARQPGDLVPDAMVGATALEFGGCYRAAKLRRIHRGHAAAGRPYEIW